MTTRRTGVDLCNCTTLRKASRRVSQMYDAKLAASGLRTTQFAILALLYELEVLSVNELAGRLDLDRTTTGKNLRPLEEAGLIKIAASPQDRRSREAALTAKGRGALKIAAPLWQEAQREFEALNGRDNSAELRATLEAIRVVD